MCLHALGALQRHNITGGHELLLALQPRVGPWMPDEA